MCFSFFLKCDTNWHGKSEMLPFKEKAFKTLTKDTGEYANKNKNQRSYLDVNLDFWIQHLLTITPWDH